MSNKTSVLNEVAVALGVWARLAVMTRCLFVMKGCASEEDGQKKKGAGGHWRDLLHVLSAITPPGNKQGLHENPFEKLRRKDKD